MKFKLKMSAEYIRTQKRKQKYSLLGFKLIKIGDYWRVQDFKPTIEFNNLKELLKFSKKYGEIIILPAGVIEIYNSWRE